MPVPWAVLPYNAASTTATVIVATTTTGWADWPGMTALPTAAGTSSTLAYSYAPPIREATPQEVARFAAQRAERDRMAQQRAARQAVVTERAAAGLLAVLSPEQRQSYLANETFRVLGSAGGRYRVWPGRAGNVYALDTQGREVAKLCAHPQLGCFDGLGRRLGFLPDQDVALAQMLALTSDEPGFLAVANVHWGRVPTPLALAA